MKPDPIVQQVHKTRRAIAGRFGNDLHAICQDARQRQAAGDRKTVRLPARPARPVPAKAG